MPGGARCVPNFRLLLRRKVKTKERRGAKLLERGGKRADGGGGSAPPQAQAQRSWRHAILFWRRPPACPRKRRRAVADLPDPRRCADTAYVALRQPHPGAAGSPFGPLYLVT
ncbi:uncharacterized protein LOC144704580 [Wolffia australiana]